MLRLRGRPRGGRGGVPAGGRPRLRPAAGAGAAVAGAGPDRRGRSRAVGACSPRTPDPVQRCRLLPAAVEVLLAAGTLDDAREPWPTSSARSRPASARPAARGHGRPGRGCARAGRGRRRRRAALPAQGAPAVGAGRRAPTTAPRVRVLTAARSRRWATSESARARAAAAAHADVPPARRPPAADEVSRLLRARGAPRRTHRARGRGAAAGRLRPQQPQIAAELVLSEKTVARHLSNIFGKLDVGLAHRRRGVRLRARARLRRRSAGVIAAEVDPGICQVDVDARRGGQHHRGLVLSQSAAAGVVDQHARAMGRLPEPRPRPHTR